MPGSAKRARKSIESQLLCTVRPTLVNPETRGRPIILYKGDKFLVLYEQELMFLQEIDLKTITMFRDDIHGPHETAVDVENLSASQLCELSKVLDAFVASRKSMQEAEERAAQRIRDSLAPP